MKHGQMRVDNEGDTISPAAMSVSEGLQKYGDNLTPYEKEEIIKYTSIYYCGQGCGNKINAPTSGPNDGFDTTDGEYIFRANDHIAYRYEILEELGSGAFGQVLKAIDHVDEQVVALKLIRNQRKVLQQAVQEINILEHVNNRDPKNLYGIVRMHESFSFRGHTCISYELLGANLYDYLKEKDFYPMSLSLIRGIAARMLVALTFLGRENIMHCDLKPENILIRGSDPSVVKLVDLGSASFDASNSYMYIQSRFYRAPEVILEQKYSKAIDWWSFGCILCELANGDPVFPGDDEKDQLGCIMEYLGPPPQSFIEASSARRKREFFDEHLEPKQRQTKKGRVRVPGSKSLAKFLGVAEDDDFLSFVRQFLQWDPATRVAPREAMRHKWICDEFVFPTKSEETRTAASKQHGDASSPEASQSGSTAASSKAAQGKSAWRSKHDAAVGPVVTADTWSSTQAAPGLVARTVGSAALPVNGHHSPGSASVPPLTESKKDVPRATALSTGGAPRRPTAMQRHSGHALRGRQRRSLDMTDVEMPRESSRSGSTTTGEAAAAEKTRNFLLPADGPSVPTDNGAAVVTSGMAHTRVRPEAPPALMKGLLSPVLSAMPATHPPNANGLQSSRQVVPPRPANGAAAMAWSKDDDHGAAATNSTITAPLTPKFSKSSSYDSPTSAERNSRVQELRRRFEASNAPAPKQDGSDHLEESTRSAAHSMRRSTNLSGLGSTTKDSGHGNRSYSAKQRHELEPVPTTPPKPPKAKSASERRREYSITLEGSPSPPPLEGLLPNERPHAHTKDYTMPSELGLDTMNLGGSLTSASRPHEPGTSFMLNSGHAGPTPAAEEARSSEETVMLSSLPNGSSSITSGGGAGAAAVSRHARDLAVMHRNTNDVKERPEQKTAAALAAEGTKGRHPPASGLLRLIPPRQQLAQRQRQNVVPAVGDGKGPSSPSTALPPLKKNFVR